MGKLTTAGLKPQQSRLCTLGYFDGVAIHEALQLLSSLDVNSQVQGNFVFRINVVKLGTIQDLKVHS